MSFSNRSLIFIGISWQEFKLLRPNINKTPFLNFYGHPLNIANPICIQNLIKIQPQSIKKPQRLREWHANQQEKENKQTTRDKMGSNYERLSFLFCFW
jgi:hypothetical protein